MKVKNISKSIITILVAFALLLGTGILALMNLTLKPTSRVYAATDAGYFGTNNSLYWEYDTVSKELTITGSGAIPDMIGSGSVNFAPWSAYADVMEKLILDDRITEIGIYAFNKCAGLKDVDLNNIEVLGDGSFGYCTGLVSVVMPSITEIGGTAFANCSSLVSVDIGPNINSMEPDIFYNCTSLESITIRATTPPTNHDTLEDYDGMEDCGDLSGVTIYLPSQQAIADYQVAWADCIDLENNYFSFAVIPGTADTGVIANIVLPSILAVTLVSVIIMYAVGLKKHKHI